MPRPAPFEELDNFSTLDLLTELRRRYSVLTHPPRSAVLLGPPGSGRASQAAALRRDWGLCAIDGEVARASGDALKSISEKLATTQCRRGFALHRFPASAEEARGLDRMLETDYKDKPVFREYRVVLLDSPEEAALQARSAGKLVHSASGRIYGKESSEGVDEVTGAKLQSREDNYAGRYKQWLETKEAVLQYFRAGRAVSVVDAGKPVEEVASEVGKILM